MNCILFIGRKVSVFILFSIVLAVSCSGVLAQWQEDGYLACGATGDQEQVKMVPDGEGGAIMVWLDERNIGSPGELYAQRIDLYGNPLWSVNGIPIVPWSQSVSYDFDILADGSGGVFIAYAVDNGQNGLDIAYQRLGPNGEYVWVDYGGYLATDIAGWQGRPVICSDGSGGIYIAWQNGESGTGADIYAGRYAADGTGLWSSNGEAICVESDDQESPFIITDGTGGFVVAWRDERFDASGDIYAQRVLATGSADWTAGGVPVAVAVNAQRDCRIIHDGEGLFMLAWYDNRNGANEIFGQRLDFDGDAIWIPGGISIVISGSAERYGIRMVTDGAGGAIVAWINDLVEDEVRIARILYPDGSPGWAPGGITVSSYGGNQNEMELESDGAGGAYITWVDDRNNPDPYRVYIQRFGSSGMTYWPLGGKSVTSDGYDNYWPDLAIGDMGSVICAWSDKGFGPEYDLWAQRYTPDGYIGHPEPILLSVLDVPSDEGGWVNVNIGRSQYDGGESWISNPVLTYNIWRRIDGPVAMNGPGTVPASSFAEAPYDDSMREFLAAAEFPPGQWAIIGSFAGFSQMEYIYTAGTLADSTAGGIPWETYIVSAHTGLPTLWFLSETDSAYSVDNMPPSPPLALSAEQSHTPEGLQLEWDDNSEGDLAYYAVYRGTNEHFVPGTGSRLATPVSPEYFDDEWRWDSGYYYKVSAVDRHGNESGFAMIAPGSVTGDDPASLPEATFLAQNFPNPFNPNTTIAFGMRSGGSINLSIYDAAGRLITVLIDETRPAGRYTAAWNGEDHGGTPVSSGVYFYHLAAGDFVQTRKMVLLR